MIDLVALQGAFAILTAQASAWIFVIPGRLIGLFFGAMPGIPVTMAMAIFLPMTRHMDLLPVIVFLTSISTGAGFGGSVPAVPMNIPGTSPAEATAFDGDPMPCRDRQNEAPGLALAASIIGLCAAWGRCRAGRCRAGCWRGCSGCCRAWGWGSATARAGWCGCRCSS